MVRFNTILYSEDAVAASANTDAVSLRNMLGYSVQLTVASGSSFSATAKLQCRNDGANWVDVAGTSKDISSDASYLWNVADCFYEEARVAITVAAGSANIDIQVQGKGA